VRRRLQVAVAAAIGAAFVVASASAASAHADLVSTSPAQSAQFATGAPPSTVAVEFDEAVSATPESVLVYDGTGRALDVATASGTRKAKRIEVGMPGKLPDGTYVVVWHIVSEGDGHPEHGAFTFTVGAGGATRADIGALLAAQSSGRVVGAFFGIARAVAFVGTLVLAGGLLFLSWRWAEALAWRAVRKFVIDAGLVATVATILTVPLQAAYSTGDRGALVDAGALGDVLSARFGRAALVRAIVLLGLVFVARRRTVRPWIVLAGAAVAFGTFAYAGHGSTGSWPLGAFVTDVVHLGAAALWLGGLAVLGVAALARYEADALRDGAARFSRVALPAIGVVVVSGTIQGWRQVHGWNALWHTEYARLLVVKVLVVVAIVIVASASRDALRARGTFDDLRHGVGIELALAVVVLGVTASLVVTIPAREEEAARQRPVAKTLRLAAAGERVRYGVVVQPALPGDNTVVVSPSLSGDGFLPAVLEGVVDDASGGAEATIAFTPLPDGRWIGVAPLPRAGAWRIRLTGSTGPQADSATTQVTIG
jgi:copper transport protein